MSIIPADRDRYTIYSQISETDENKVKVEGFEKIGRDIVGTILFIAASSRRELCDFRKVCRFFNDTAVKIVRQIDIASMKEFADVLVKDFSPDENEQGKNSAEGDEWHALLSAINKTKLIEIRCGLSSCMENANHLLTKPVSEYPFAFRDIFIDVLKHLPRPITQILRARYPTELLPAGFRRLFYILFIYNDIYTGSSADISKCIRKLIQLQGIDKTEDVVELFEQPNEKDTYLRVLAYEALGFSSSLSPTEFPFFFHDWQASSLAEEQKVKTIIEKITDTDLKSHISSLSTASSALQLANKKDFVGAIEKLALIDNVNLFHLLFKHLYTKIVSTCDIERANALIGQIEQQYEKFSAILESIKRKNLKEVSSLITELAVEAFRDAVRNRMLWLSDIVKINVGGKSFSFTRITLQQPRNKGLTPKTLETSDATKEPFLDIDSTIFRKYCAPYIRFGLLPETKKDFASNHEINHAIATCKEIQLTVLAKHIEKLH